MTSQLSSTDLHNEALVIDSHNDTIVGHIRRGNVSIADKETPDRIRHDGTIAYMRGPLDRVASQMEIQINLPKMRQGGVDAAFFAIDVTRAWKNHLSYALDAIGFLRQKSRPTLMKSSLQKRRRTFGRQKQRVNWLQSWLLRTATVWNEA